MMFSFDVASGGGDSRDIEASAERLFRTWARRKLDAQAAPVRGLSPVAGRFVAMGELP
jgi:hypothetical protein